MLRLLPLLLLRSPARPPALAQTNLGYHGFIALLVFVRKKYASAPDHEAWGWR